MMAIIKKSSSELMLCRARIIHKNVKDSVKKHPRGEVVIPAETAVLLCEFVESLAGKVSNLEATNALLRNMNKKGIKTLPTGETPCRT